MKLGYLLFYVENVERSLKFYESAFGIPTRFLHESKTYGECETGATALGFVDRAFVASQKLPVELRSPTHYRAEIGLTSEQIDVDFDKALKAGAILVKPITEKPWGQKVGYVLDLDGNLVEICTPMSR